MRTIQSDLLVLSDLSHLVSRSEAGHALLMTYRKAEPLQPDEKRQLENLCDGLKRRFGFTAPLLQVNDPHPTVVVDIRQHLGFRLSEVERGQDIKRAITALMELPDGARPAQVKQALEAEFGKGYFEPTR